LITAAKKLIAAVPRGDRVSRRARTAKPCVRSASRLLPHVQAFSATRTPICVSFFQSTAHGKHLNEPRTGSGRARHRCRRGSLPAPRRHDRGGVRPALFVSARQPAEKTPRRRYPRWQNGGPAGREHRLYVVSGTGPHSGLLRGGRAGGLCPRQPESHGLGP
jgi:hypothetical protein